MRVILIVGGQLVQLSPRERQVCRLLAHGNTNKLIGHKLGISVSTVKGHVARMTTTLVLENRVQLCVWAIAHPESISGLAVPSVLVLPFASCAA